MSDDELNIPFEEFLSEYQDILESLENGSFDILSEMPPVDGMFQKNHPWQIRIGMIQDPAYFAAKNRINPDGTLVKSAESVLSSAEKEYPFNGVNAVDPTGMRVSIVWLDGFDGGLYQDATGVASTKLPVSQVWLDFSNAWADLDRNCGDFHLPPVGTIVKVQMSRNNVGTVVGMSPSDRGKLPLLKLGEFMRKAFNQNVHFLTDRIASDAFKCLEQDIFKPEPVGEVRAGTEESPKTYETDEEKLGSLRYYSAHRDILASNGLARSAKISSGKHKTVDGKRTFYFETGLAFNAAWLEIKEAIGEDDITSVVIMNGDGVFTIHQDSNKKRKISLVTQLTFADAWDAVSTTFTYQKIANVHIQNEKYDISIIPQVISEIPTHTVTCNTTEVLNVALTALKLKLRMTSGALNCADGNLQFTCINTTAMLNPSMTFTSGILTLTQFAAISGQHFGGITGSLNLQCADSNVTFAHVMGSSQSSITPAGTQLSAITTILGRLPKWYSCSGPDTVLSGDCPRSPSTPINTCSRPSV